MKTNNETIEAVFTNLPGQAKPFAIHGDPEVLMDYAATLQAEDAANARTARVSHSAPKVAQVAVMEPEPVLEGRRASLAAKLYDLAHGRNMYQLLKEQREAERDLAMAKRLGLITTDRCAKHEKQLAIVRGL